MDGFWLVDQQRRLLEVNEAYCRMSGYSERELLAMTVSDLEAVESPPEVEARVRKMMVEGGARFESRHKRKDGSVFDVEVGIKHEPVDGGRFVVFVRDVTERKKADESLRASEENLRAMFQMASIGIAQADPQSGRWLRVNQKMCAITGYTASELLQMRVPEITHPEDQAVDWEAFQRVVRGEAADYCLEKRYIRKDGVAVWVNVNMTVIRDATGRPTRTMATIEDITGRKLAEEALRKSEGLLKDAQRIASLGCYVLDISSGRWSSSDVLDDVFGIDKSYDRSVEGWLALVHSGDRAMMADYLKSDVIGRNQPFNKEYRIIRQRDHGNRWVHGLGRLECDARGRPVEMRGTIRDITERKDAESKMESRLAELKQWYVVTLGREQRVIELKREVNELAAKAGEPLRYPQGI